MTGLSTYALKKCVNNKKIPFNNVSPRMVCGLYWFLLFFSPKMKVPLQALNTQVIYTQIQQYSDLIDFNILVMFRPAILHRGLTSALRGLCVSAWCNRETLSEIDRPDLREPPSVPQPLCLRYWSPYGYACMRVCACTCVSFPFLTDPFLSVWCIPWHFFYNQPER